MANGTRHREEVLNVAPVTGLARGVAAMEAGLERLFDVATAVSNLATQAEIFHHTECPVDLDRALMDLSMLLTELEPRIKGYPR